MIESRRVRNPDGSLSKVLEYHLQVKSIDVWMTPKQLSELNGCELGAEGIKGRMQNPGDNPKFKTLEGCVYTPKQVNGNSCREARLDKKGIENSQSELKFNQMLENARLFTVLKDKNLKPLIMQSKPI